MRKSRENDRTMGDIMEMVKVSASKEYTVHIGSGFLGTIGEKIKEIGSNIVEGLWNGINNMASWIKEKIGGFGDSVLGALKDFFGINSPSKLMRDEVGKWIPEGIAVGIDKNAKSVLSSMRNMTAGVVGAGQRDEFAGQIHTPGTVIGGKLIVIGLGIGAVIFLTQTIPGKHGTNGILEFGRQFCFDG